MKQEIEIEGLPDGWVAVAYRVVRKSEYYLAEGKVFECDAETSLEYIIVEKIQPRRIIMEETEEIMTEDKSGYVLLDGATLSWIQTGERVSPDHKIWKVVE